MGETRFSVSTLEEVDLEPEVREALEAGTFDAFRAQFKADRARGV